MSKANQIQSQINQLVSGLGLWSIRLDADCVGERPGEKPCLITILHELLVPGVVQVTCENDHIGWELSRKLWKH